jgi:signal transduction histidine kinase
MISDMIQTDETLFGKAYLTDLGYTLIFDTLIAAILTYILKDSSFWAYFVISQAIGLSICSICHTALFLFRPQRPLSVVALLGITIVLGGLLGGGIGGWITGKPVVAFFHQPAATARTVVLSLLFGGVIAFFFFSRKEMAQIRELADQERIRRLTSEKQTVQTQLKLLQAQIEPHFLFNTLSTIASLLDTDLAAGKAMLSDLTRYLRASLATTRAARTTLGGELELVAAYLNILKGRMGRRLQVAIDIPDALKPLPLAPMLIQPLVENAVIHGIDPQITGGAIEIRVQRNDGAVEIVVADTGGGFSMDARSDGMGIANVRERLAALYGDQGRLRFTENRPTGVRAIIEVPYADNPSRDHRR